METLIQNHATDFNHIPEALSSVWGVSDHWLCGSCEHGRLWDKLSNSLFHTLYMYWGYCLWMKTQFCMDRNQFWTYSWIFILFWFHHLIDILKKWQYKFNVARHIWYYNESVTRDCSLKCVISKLKWITKMAIPDLTDIFAYCISRVNVPGGNYG